MGSDWAAQGGCMGSSEGHLAQIMGDSGERGIGPSSAAAVERRVVF